MIEYKKNQLDCCGCDDSCEQTTTQEAVLCVPVTFSPYAIPGAPIVTCCGDACIDKSGGACGGTVGGECKFNIVQKLSVTIPVAFGASVEYGQTQVNCSGDKSCPGEAHALPKRPCCN